MVGGFAGRSRRPARGDAALAESCRHHMAVGELGCGSAAPGVTRSTVVDGCRAVRQLEPRRRPRRGRRVPGDRLPVRGGRAPRRAVATRRRCGRPCERSTGWGPVRPPTAWSPKLRARGVRSTRVKPSASGRRAGRAERPRDRGAAPRRRRIHQPADRRDVVHQPQDGRAPRVEHPHQARRRVPGRRPRAAFACASGSPPRVRSTGAAEQHPATACVAGAQRMGQLPHARGPPMCAPLGP